MKNTLFLCICMLTVTSVQAQSQLEKGKKLVGFQVNLIESDLYYTHPALSFGSTTSSFGMNLIPTYAVALQRNWLVGGQATLGYNYYKYEDGGNTSVDKYFDAGIGPFTRLYLDLLRNGKLKLFGNGSVELIYHKRQSSYNTTYSSTPAITNQTETSLNAALGFGLAYFGNGLSVDMSISNLGLRMGFYLPHRTSIKK
jgi:hypothetical protein